MAFSNEVAENLSVGKDGGVDGCLPGSVLTVFHITALLPFFYGCELFEMMEYLVEELK